MLTQSRILFVLFCSEFATRFSYWGIQSLLVLYLIHYLHLSNTQSYEIFGAFTASTFILSIIGGLLADNWFGFKKTLITGIILALIGNILLYINAGSSMILGLACISYGIGIFLPNNSNLLGSYYSENDERRDRGFTILYIGTNTGGLLGPVFSGIIIALSSFRDAFLVNAIFLFLWLVLYVFTARWFREFGNVPAGVKLKPFYQGLILGAITLIFLLIFFKLLTHPAMAGVLLAIIGIATLSYLSYSIYRHYRLYLQKILLLLVMTLIALFFFACELQTNSSLLEFINQYVNRQIGFFTVPTETFAAFEPAFVILSAPVLAFIWHRLQLKNKEPAAFNKVLFGLALSALAFLVFGYSASLISATNKTVSVAWILLANLILGAAEVCIMPPLIAGITRLAPPTFKATLMGTLYVALAFSGYLTGIIAKMTTTHPKPGDVPTQGYAHIYYQISLISIAIVISLLLLTYVVKSAKFKSPV